MAHVPVPRKTASFGVAIAAAFAFAMAQWPVAAEQETPRPAATRCHGGTALPHSRHRRERRHGTARSIGESAGR